MIIIIDNKIYIENVGDSRAILSLNYGNEYLIVTEDHKPSIEKEKARILKKGVKFIKLKRQLLGLKMKRSMDKSY